MSDEKITKYPGDNAEVSWNGGLCIHIGECGSHFIRNYPGTPQLPYLIGQVFID